MGGGGGTHVGKSGRRGQLPLLGGGRQFSLEAVGGCNPIGASQVPRQGDDDGDDGSQVATQVLCPEGLHAAGGAPHGRGGSGRACPKDSWQRQVCNCLVRTLLPRFGGGACQHSPRRASRRLCDGCRHQKAAGWGRLARGVWPLTNIRVSPVGPHGWRVYTRVVLAGMVRGQKRY